MKLTGRWFPQIVDRDSGNLYPIYIYNKNCGVSFCTCSREISGDRVVLFHKSTGNFLNILFDKQHSRSTTSDIIKFNFYPYNIFLIIHL